MIWWTALSRISGGLAFTSDAPERAMKSEGW